MLCAARRALRLTPICPTPSLTEIASKNFGLLIAYVIPGFVAVWGVAYVSPVVSTWLNATPSQAPTIGGFLYATLGAIAAGVTVSAVRWLVIDTVHHRTGIPAPEWDVARLETKLQAYESIAEDHYRYYQFYANTLVAGLCAYATYRAVHPTYSQRVAATDAAFLLLECVLFAGSRDALRKYHLRVSRLLGVVRSPKLSPKRSPPMTNGKHPPKKATSTRKPSEAKSQAAEKAAAAKGNVPDRR